VSAASRGKERVLPILGGKKGPTISCCDILLGGEIFHARRWNCTTMKGRDLTLIISKGRENTCEGL